VGREEVKSEMMRDSPLEHRFLRVDDDVCVGYLGLGWARRRL